MTPTCTDCGTPVNKSRAKRCRPCHAKTRRGDKPARPRTYCEDCGAECRRTVCIRCQRRTYDASELELTGGRWLRRGHRLVWVSVEEEIAEYARRQLLVERYERNDWWTRHGVLFDDTDLVRVARRREMVAEFAEFERAERSAS